MLDNALDGAILAGSISALQDDQDFVIAFDEVTLQLDQFDLKFAQCVLVSAFRDRGRVPARCLLFVFFSSQLFTPFRPSEIVLCAVGG